MAPSQHGESDIRPPPPRTRVWIHFLGLLGLAAAVAVLNGLVASPGATLGDALRGWHERMYALVPVAAGISVGLGLGVRLRTAAQIVALSTLLMVGLDLLPPSGQSAFPGTVMVNSAGQVERRVRGVGNRAASGALLTTVDLLQGELPQADERLTSYEGTHDRVMAAHGLLKLGLLFTPLIAAGAVLGLAAWIEQRVLFRSGRDEVLAMMLFAWLVSPLAVILSDKLAVRAQEAALFGGGPLWMMLVAYGPPLLVGSVGWTTYHRWHDAD